MGKTNWQEFYRKLAKEIIKFEAQIICESLNKQDFFDDNIKNEYINNEYYSYFMIYKTLGNTKLEDIGAKWTSLKKFCELDDEIHAAGYKKIWGKGTQVINNGGLNKEEKKNT